MQTIFFIVIINNFVTNFYTHTRAHTRARAYIKQVIMFQKK